MPDDPQIPDWHSEESRKIELLRWRDCREDFEALCANIIGRIDTELREKGLRIHDLAAESELKAAIRIAAESYNEEDRTLIGLQTHATLFLRGYIAQKMRQRETPPP